MKWRFQSLLIVTYCKGVKGVIHPQIFFLTPANVIKKKKTVYIHFSNCPVIQHRSPWTACDAPELPINTPENHPLFGRVCINPDTFATQFPGDSKKNKERWQVQLQKHSWGIHFFYMDTGKKVSYFYGLFWNPGELWRGRNDCSRLWSFFWCHSFPVPFICYTHTQRPYIVAAA